MAVTGHPGRFDAAHHRYAEKVVRLRDLGLEPFAVAEVVELIIAQRFVRRLCRTCQPMHSAMFNLVDGG
jgi:general secretion pathway protein E